MSKFWSTQPINNGVYPEFVYGKIKELDKNTIENYLPKNLLWFSLDVNNDIILNAIHEFLSNHYVTDCNNMYRLDYSKEFLKFGLKSPKDLTNPVTNAHIAYLMSNGGKNWTAWHSNPGQRDYQLVKNYAKEALDLN